MLNAHDITMAVFKYSDVIVDTKSLHNDTEKLITENHEIVFNIEEDAMISYSIYYGSEFNNELISTDGFLIVSKDHAAEKLAEIISTL